MKENVCRTCLGSDCLLPLFPSFSDLEHMEKALFLCTGIKITNNDGLPQQICYRCSKSLQNAMKFRTQTQKSDNKLLQQYKYDNERIDNAIAKDEFDIKKNEITDLKRQSLDGNNDSSFRSELDDVPTSSHRESFTSEDEVLSETKYAKETTNAKESADKDNCKESESTRKRYLELIEGPIVPKEPIQCKICKKYSKSLNTFEKHAMSHLGYNILCEFCAKSCISITSLLRHQRAKHGLARDNSFPCSFCGYQAIDREQLEVHERKVHTKERPFTCDDCGAGFFSKRVLIQHRVNHKADKPFQCDICPSKFKLRCHLTNHMNRVHNKNSFKYMYGCHICSKRYSSTGDARKHIAKIHGVPVEQQGKVHRFYFQPQQ